MSADAATVDRRAARAGGEAAPRPPRPGDRGGLERGRARRARGAGPDQPGLAERPRHLLLLERLQATPSRTFSRGFWLDVKLFMRRRGRSCSVLGLVVAPRPRRAARRRCSRCACWPRSSSTSFAASRRSCWSTWSASGSRRSSSSGCRPTRSSSAASRYALLRRLRRRGLPGRDRSVHRGQRDAALAIGLTEAPGAALRDPAAGGPPGRPAAAERLHRAPEGRRAGLAPRRRRGVSDGPGSPPSTFNYTPLMAAALLYLCVTVPLARLVDRTGARRQDALMSAPVLELRGRHQVLRRPRGAARDRPRGRRARGGRADRRVRLGEVDAPSLHRPAGGDRRRRRLPRRRRDHRPVGGPRRGPPPARPRLPGLQPVPAPDRAPEHRPRRRARPRRLPRRGRGAARAACSSASASRAAATTTPTSSRAASSSASRSPASFAGRPRALLLDEVTSALDPELVGEVLDAVRDLKAEGVTMVIATHEMGFAREVADRVGFLHDGRIVELGTPGARSLRARAARDPAVPAPAARGRPGLAAAGWPQPDSRRCFSPSAALFVSSSLTLP